MIKKMITKSAKKLVALLLTVLMLISLMPAAVFGANAYAGSYVKISGDFNGWSFTDSFVKSSDSDDFVYTTNKTLQNFINGGNNKAPLYFIFQISEDGTNWHYIRPTENANGTIAKDVPTDYILSEKLVAMAAFYIANTTDGFTDEELNKKVLIHINSAGQVWYTLTDNEDPTTPTTPPDPDAVKIYFKIPDNWNSANAYVYDGLDEYAKWPGKPMTESAEYPGFWEYYIPSEFKDNINTRVIFNNGMGLQIPASQEPGFLVTSKSHTYVDGEWTSFKPYEEATDLDRPQRPADVEDGGDNYPLHYVSADLFNYYYDKDVVPSSVNKQNRNGELTDTFNTAISDYFKSNESNIKEQTVWGYKAAEKSTSWRAYDGPDITEPAPEGRPQLIYWNNKGRSNTEVAVWAWNDAQKGIAYTMTKVEGTDYYYVYLPSGYVNLIFLDTAVPSGKEGTVQWPFTSGKQMAAPGDRKINNVKDPDQWTESTPLYDPNYTSDGNHGYYTQNALTPLYFGTLWNGTSIENASLLNDSLYNKYTPAQMANRKDSALPDKSSMHAVAQGLVDNKLNDDGMLTQLGIVMPYFNSDFLAQKTDGTIQGKLGSSYKTWFPMNVSETNGVKTYFYDSNTDKNRYYNIYKNSEMTLVDQLKNPNDGHFGYYPFSNSNSNMKFANGTKLEINFYMSKDGKITAEDGSLVDMKFNFSGDDDMWVFIDGYLAMDMGGAHCAAYGSIDFTTLSSTVMTSQSDIDSLNGGKGSAGGYLAAFPGTEKNDTSDSPYSAQSTYEFPDELKDSLKDLVNPHKLTFFYMERGFLDSNMKITYNIPETPQASYVNVENKVDFTNINKGLLTSAKLTAYNNHAFAYDVQGNKSSSNAQYISYTNNKDLVRKFNADTSLASPYTFAKDDSSFSNYFIANDSFISLPLQNVAYYLSDDENGDSGYSPLGGLDTYLNSSDKHYLPLMYNQKASYVYQFDLGSNVKIGQSAYMLKPNAASNTVNYSATNKKVSDLYDTKWRLLKNTDEEVNSGSPVSALSDVYVTDTNTENIANNCFTNGITFADKDAAIYTAEFINTPKAYDISVTKQVDCDLALVPNQEFIFYIDLAGVFTDESYTSSVSEYNSSDFKGYKLEYTVSNSDEKKYTSLDENGKASFILKAGETAVFTGIPVGTTYRIYESKEINRVITPAGTLNFAFKDVSATAASANKITLNNGCNAIYDKVSENVSVTFTNSAEKQKYNIAYAYHERHLENGQPTYVDNSKYVLANIKETDRESTYASILKNAPNIDNIIDSYFLTTDNVTENADLSTVFKEDNATGALECDVNAYPDKPVGTSDKIVIDDKHMLILAYIGNASKRYNVNYIAPAESGENETKNYITKKYNDLVAGDINAPKSAEGRGNFLYWAVEKYADPVSNKVILNPVSTQDQYRYRITDDTKLIAVYEKDVASFNSDSSPYSLVSNLELDENDNSSPNGFGAVALNTVYDKYTQYDGTFRNMVRMNINIGAVGSPDMDNKIEEIGYIRYYGTTSAEYNIDNYPSINKSKNDILTDIVSGTNSGKGVYVKKYSVANYLNPDINDPYPKSDSGKSTSVNLTNKNRANFVLTISNNEANKNKYFTIYAYIKRNGNIYVSPTPSLINLQDPAFTGETANIQPSGQYIINSSVNKIGDSDAETDTSDSLSVRTSATLVNDGERVKITAKVLADTYSSETSKSSFAYKLDSITVGTKTYTASNGDITEIFKNNTGTDKPTVSYILNYYVSPEDAENGKINVIANFSSFNEQDSTNVKTIKVRVTGKGTVTFVDALNSSNTFIPDEKGIVTIPATIDMVNVIFTPNDGYEFSHFVDSSLTFSENGGIIIGMLKSYPISTVEFKAIFSEIL